MNIKVLASLGVIVALLTAWLLVSLYSASRVEITPTQEAAVERSGGSLDAVLEGQSMGVSTSVDVANKDVKTSVTVAE